MEYKVTNIETNGDTVNTTVLITFDCKVEKTITIPHFRPTSKEDIFLGIENRMISEENAHKAETKNKQLIETLGDVIDAVVEFKTT